MKRSYPSLILEDKFIRDFITTKLPRSAVAQILIFRTLDYIKVEIHTAPTKNLSILSSPNKTKNSNSGRAVSAQVSPEVVSEQQNKIRQNKTQGANLEETYDNSTNGLNLKILQEDLQIALQKYKKNTLSLLFSNPKNLINKENSLSEKNSSVTSNVTIGIMVKQLNKPFQYASVFAKYLATQLEKRENTVKQALNRSLRLIQNYNIEGIKIKISGRLNGVDIAEQESIFRGRIPLSSINANIDYCYETSKTLYGILGVKVWIFREDNN